jgi:hypothetical protein
MFLFITGILDCSFDEELSTIGVSLITILCKTYKAHYYDSVSGFNCFVLLYQ